MPPGRNPRDGRRTARIAGHPATPWVILTAAFAYPLFPIISGDPGVAADPLEFLLEHYGLLATLLLVAVLSLTPLRTILPQSDFVRALNRHRRLTGVAAFVAALLHLSAYLLHTGSPDEVVRNLGKPFILAGLGAWLILALLAVTSLRHFVRRLGGRRWKQLHRLAYVAALLAFAHQAMQEKAGMEQTLTIFLPLLMLQALRVALPAWRGRARPRA